MREGRGREDRTRRNKRKERFEMKNKSLVEKRERLGSEDGVEKRRGKEREKKRKKERKRKEKQKEKRRKYINIIEKNK